MRHADRLTRRSTLVLTASAAALSTIGAARADLAEMPDWFQLDKDIVGDVVNGWRYRVAADGDRIEIVRRAGTGAARRVFVLYPRRSSAYDTAMTKILAVFLEKDINTAFTIVNFHTDDARGHAAVALAKQIGSDLVFSMGSESTAWLHRHFVNGPIPVVSVCSKDPVMLGQTKQYDAGSGTNFAFTSLNMPVDVQLAYLLSLLPELKNIGILVDGTNVSAVETQAKPIAEVARRRGIQVFDVVVKDPKQAKQELGQLVPGAVATMRKSDPSLSASVFWITGSTAVFNEIGTINQHSDRVPVLSVVPDVVDGGDLSAVLSIGISFESNGHLAAIYGAEILSGRRKAGELPVGIVSPPDIAINFRIARQIGLRVPFHFIESADIIYDYDGNAVRRADRSVQLLYDGVRK